MRRPVAETRLDAAKESNEENRRRGVECARGRNTKQLTLRFAAGLARKDQEVEIGARSEARVLYILYDEISARARTT